jgi:hypothetical protein
LCDWYADPVRELNACAAALLQALEQLRANGGTDEVWREEVVDGAVDLNITLA